jgi:ABC-2 type transport system permease protein
MNIHRIGVLLDKELRHGTRNFIFVFATVIPVVVSLIVSLVFGNLFSQTPRLGILDAGRSQLVLTFQTQDYLDTRIYADAAALRYDVERGAVEMGIIIPIGFDAAVRSSGETDITIYFWGEGQTGSRATLITALATNIASVAELDTPVAVEAVPLGETEITSWSVRLLPLLVLMSIILGGTLVPAVSLVNEKQGRTLQALIITPTSILEVLAAKALLGIGLSLTMGIVILVLNQAFGTNPFLLVMVLVLGASAAGVFGVMLGTLVRDMGGLFTVIKSLAILLYAPAIIQMVPQLPQGLAQIFPTYYLIAPIQDIALNGATWAEVSTQVLILIGLIALLLVSLGVIVRRQHQQQMVVL